MNNLNIESKASFTDSTYGGGSIQVIDGQLNANVKVGKEYKGNADVNINGNTIASVDASAKGEVNAEINKNKISAQAGVDANANAQASFGKTEVKFSLTFDFHFEFTFDFKSGLHFFRDGKGLQFEGHLIDKENGKRY